MSEEIKETQQVEKKIEPVKAETTTKTYSEAEYNALKTQLENLKQSTKDNEDFKKKFEDSEKARKDFEHKTKLSNYVKSLGLKNDIYENHVLNLLTEKDLKFENDKLIGGDDIVKTFKESHSDAFKSAESTPKFVAGTSNSKVNEPDDSLLRAVMGLKNK